MGIVRYIHLFLQCAERTLPATVAYVRRLCVTGTFFLLKVWATQVAYGAAAAELELLKGVTSGTDMGLLTVITFLAGIVANSDCSHPNMVRVCTYFPGNGRLVLVERQSNLNKGFLGIEHLLDILTIL